MNELHDILEKCLQEIEKGADLDSVLFRYPAHASELRPILETAIKAIKVASPDPSSDVVQRNRAKILQHAAQMRESKVHTTRRLWSVPLRRALVTLVVVGALFMSSTGLVRAASTTVPGDNLYPVKRTWEDVLVLFTFNIQDREALEVEHENERLDELNELFTEGRSVQVDFSGLVTRQNENLWLISGIPVAILAQTGLPSQPIVVGDAIHVVGTTQQDGVVIAQRLELLPSGVPLPEIIDDDSFELEQDRSGDSNQPGEDNSGKGSEGEAPNVGEKTQTSESESESGSSESDDKSFSGVVESINGNILIVNGQIVNLSSADVNGTPRVGTSVKVEGYYDSNGLFIVTKIEVESSGSNDGSGSGSDDDAGNDNNNDDNDNGNENDNDGEDDHGGGNSGSGGGGGDD